MKTIIIISKTHGVKEVLIDDEDFEYISKFKWHLKKHRNTFYAVRTQWNSDTKTNVHYKMHRVLLGLKLPSDIGDHKDHNGLNNQRKNIRKCTNTQNRRNVLSRKNSSSKYLGVSFCKKENKFSAFISINKKSTFIASAENSIDGEIRMAKCYDEYAKKYFGEFANLNFKCLS